MSKIQLNLFNLFKSTNCVQRYGTFSVVKPGKVSRLRHVPSSIPKPEYYESGIPSTFLDKIEIKNTDQISRMRESCLLAAKILHQIENIVKVGKTTDEIDAFAHQLIIENNAYPSPLNYYHFPKSICTSINNVACHGIPDDRPLEDGDIINIDVTVYLKGFHGDCSKTFLVGNVDPEAKNLVEATKKCLIEGINVCKPGEQLQNIGKHIEENAKKMGYNVVPSFIGHGIGSYFHGPPDIYHHFEPSYQGIMEPGMTFTIEPVLSCGTNEIEILRDGWTAVTTDNSRTAQFEHTVLITDNGREILTKI